MRRQSGFTLIELMIGMLVGLIVLSAVVYAFISTLSSSRDILNSARLNREVSSLTDILVGELRRTGYFPVSVAYSGTNSGFGSVVTDLYVASDCILYGYYDDSIASTAYRGFYFDLANKRLMFGLVASTDSSLCTTLPNQLSSEQISVNTFTADLECTDLNTMTVVSDAACSALPAVSKYSRAISVTLGFNVASDTNSGLIVDEFVKLPNDYAAD